MNTNDAAHLAKIRIATASGEAKSIRESRMLTLTDVARTCGVDQSTVWRWENGHRAPRGSAALRYAKLLDVLRQVTQ